MARRASTGPDGGPGHHAVRRHIISRHLASDKSGLIAGARQDLSPRGAFPRLGCEDLGQA